MEHNSVLVLVGPADACSATRFAETGWSDLRLNVVDTPDASAIASSDLIIVTPSASEPLGAARSFRRLRPAGKVIFIVAPDRLERMRGVLPFSPEISDAAILDAGVSDAELERDVRRMLASAARHREIQGLYGRINAQLGARKTPEAASASLDERHLALAERYLTAILANAPDALMAVALDGAIVSWNERRSGSSKIPGTRSSARASSRSSKSPTSRGPRP